MRLLLGALCLAAFACAGTTKPADTYFQQAQSVKHLMPEPSATSGEWWERALFSTVRPLGRMVSPAAYLEMAIGTPRALDVNDFGQVPDSGWFTNRINRGRVTVEQVRQGPGPSLAPARGALRVISGKLEGVSPGFVVRDTGGVVWFVKFDDPAYPGLSTGAEMVASRLLHAAGYNVPQNYLVDLDLSRLDLDPRARTRDHYNRDVQLDQQALDTLLRNLNPDRDNRLRALFSRQIPGRPLGPFFYRGTRADDPNDQIPHQRRRSLRGLRFFFAWLNNTDASYHNTLDTFIGGQRGRVDHYLIDFGDSLGAASAGEKRISNGHEQEVDWPSIGARWLSFGLRDPKWLAVKRSPLREVGVFEAEVFDPLEWVPRITNPAFAEADGGDLTWAASILAHFTADDIRAAIAAARYREPAAREWIFRILVRRRAKILEAAFARGSALDLPRIDDGRLELADLVIVAGLDSPPARYNWQARWNRDNAPDQHLGSALTDEPALDLRPIAAGAHQRWGQPFADEPRLTFAVRRETSDGDEPWLEVDIDIRDGRAYPVAMRR